MSLWERVVLLVSSGFGGGKKREQDWEEDGWGRGGATPGAAVAETMSARFAHMSVQVGLIALNSTRFKR